MGILPVGFRGIGWGNNIRALNGVIKRFMKGLSATYRTKNMWVLKRALTYHANAMRKMIKSLASGTRFDIYA
jgi:hypothetical protein